MMTLTTSRRPISTSATITLPRGIRTARTAPTRPGFWMTLLRALSAATA